MFVVEQDRTKAVVIPESDIRVQARSALDSGSPRRVARLAGDEDQALPAAALSDMPHPPRSHVGVGHYRSVQMTEVDVAAQRQWHLLTKVYPHEVVVADRTLHGPARAVVVHVVRIRVGWRVQTGELDLVVGRRWQLERKCNRGHAQRTCSGLLVLPAADRGQRSLVAHHAQRGGL